MVEIEDDPIEKIIMLEMQLNDFGHTEQNGDFTCTKEQHELFIKCCRNAAKSIREVLSIEERVENESL